MTENLSAVLYLISSVCFIMALKGLSSPDSARQGNMFGIAGIARPRRARGYQGACYHAITHPSNRQPKNVTPSIPNEKI